MSEIFNVYCDESCHLENDGIPVMVLGAIWCPQKQRAAIARAIRALKVKHGFSSQFEVKWNKVSSSKVDFYLELVDLFFDDERLHFRGVVIPDKTKLNHSAFFQTHDDFYYKMYFRLFTVILEEDNRYRIYLDIKDTQSQEKVLKLKEVLRSALSHDVCTDLFEYGTVSASA